MNFKDQQRISYITIPGTNFIALEDDTNLTPKALKRGTIVIEDEIAAIPEIQSLKKGHVCLDIGAYVGDTALILGEQGATVFAFESQPDAFIAALWNTMSSQNIFVINQAVGNGSKVACNQDALDGNLGTRTTLENKDGERSLTIDEFMQQQNVPRLDCIKADAEGQELNVLLGAVESIKKFHPIILCEIYHEMLEKAGASAERIYGLLDKLDYEWRVVIGDSSEPRFDLLATKKSVLLDPIIINGNEK